MSAVAVGAAVVGAAGSAYSSSQNKKAAAKAAEAGAGGQTGVSTSEPWLPMQQWLLSGNQERRLKSGVTPTYKTPQTAPSWIDSEDQSTGYTPESRNGWGDNEIYKPESYADSSTRRYNKETGKWQDFSEGSQDQTLTNPDSDYETVGSPGLLGEANRLYGQGGMSDAQKWTLQNQAEMMQRFRSDTGLLDSIWSNGRNASAGKFDTNFGAVPDVNAVNARSGQGLLDPTSAMQQQLSGTPNNPYLDQQAQAITGQATRNFNENILPQIRSGATAAGQYGSSRQGIAEGLAASRLQQDLAPAITNLYGGAYENAQQRQYGTANNLNNQALQNAQFNANLGLQNNSQQMAQASQNLQNRVTGANLITGGMSGLNQSYESSNAAYDALQSAPWNNLSRLQSVLQPLAGLGNTTNQNQTIKSTPMYSNTAGSILGGAMTGYGAAKNFGFGATAPAINTADPAAAPQWGGSYAGFNNPDNYG